MKLFRNDSCYVDINDIKSISEIPNAVSSEYNNDVYFSPKTRFVKFTHPESIEFFSKLNEIIDYDSLSCYSTEAIIDLIEDLSRRIKYLNNKYIKSNDIKKQKLVYDEEYNRELRRLRIMLINLDNYKNNREYIDFAVNELFDDVKSK